MKVVCLFTAATDTLLELAEIQPIQLAGIDHQSKWRQPGPQPKVLTLDKALPEDFAATTAAYRELAFMASGTSGGALIPLLEYHLSVFQTNLKELEALGPVDVIIAQVQEQGDWFTVRQAEEALAALWKMQGGGRPKIVQMDAKNLKQGFEEMLEIARSLKRPEDGARLFSSLAKRIALASTMTQGRPKRKVAVLQWLEPVYTAGGWTSELLTLANAEDVFAPKDFRPSIKLPLEINTLPSGSNAALPALEVTPQVIGSHKPDLIIFSLCGYDLRTSLLRAHEALQAVEWRKLLAQQPQLKFIAFEAVELFSRQGPHFASTLQALVEALHPEIQPFGNDSSALYHRFSASEIDQLPRVAASAHTHKHSSSHHHGHHAHGHGHGHASDSKKTADLILG